MLSANAPDRNQLDEKFDNANVAVVCGGCVLVMVTLQKAKETRADPRAVRTDRTRFVHFLRSPLRSDLPGTECGISFHKIVSITSLQGV